MTIDELAPHHRPAVAGSSVVHETTERALRRLRAAQHELVRTAVTESLLMSRNVALVQALESGVPAHLVQEVTRMSPAAFELAVARGIYYRDHAARRHG